MQTCSNLPFGDGLNCSAAGATPTYFTGYLRDGETNLDFANARYFSSQFGRFMSPDSVGGNVADPQSFNLYAYVLNNPLSAVDPSGLNPCELVAGVFVCPSVYSRGGGGTISGGGGVPVIGGPFGGGSLFGGLGFGNLGLCFTFNCGFGGGGFGSSIPGPPSAGQIASEGSLSPGSSTGVNIATGVVGELYNNVRPLAIFTALQSGDLFGALRFYRMGEFVPQNATQTWAARVTAAATIFIPGGGEEAIAAKVEGKLSGKIAELTAEAEKLYPKLAGKFQLHHIIPKYLGGTADGTLSRIPAAYHQRITNAFRELAPYGQKFNGSLEKLLETIYKRFPLP